MSSIPQILARIAKLRQMTEANGCTEAEAATAMAKLTALITEYNISPEALAQPTPEFIADSWNYSGPNYWSLVNRAVEDLFSVKLWSKDFKDPVFGPSTTQYCFGTAPDVAAALAMASICHLAIVTASANVKKQEILSFHYGMAKRLAERIRELIAKSTTDSRALTLNRKVAVWNVWNQNYRGLHGRRPVNGTINQAAYAAGAAAANFVRLGFHKEVGGTRQLTYKE